MREYPHQMSGGMRQRVVGAIAMAGGPKLIIADDQSRRYDPGAVPGRAEGFTLVGEPGPGTMAPSAEHSGI